MKIITSTTLTFVFLLCAITVTPLSVSASTTNGTIDASFKLTRVCKNVGCTTYGNINWKPTINGMTPGAQPVAITDTTITGHIWGDEIGWIKLNQTGLTGPQTLKVNPSTGVVTGFAYSSGGSWINFSPTQATTSTTTVGVTINSVGEFVGWAWASGPYGGWMKFDCGSAGTCIKTDWRPIPHREACQNGIDDDADGQTDFPSDSGCTSATATSEVAVVVPPPGGGGGGGGGGTFGGILPPGVTNNASNPPANTGTTPNVPANTPNTTGDNQTPSPVPYIPVPTSATVETDNESAALELPSPSSRIQATDIRVSIQNKPVPPVVRTVETNDRQVRTFRVNEVPIRSTVTQRFESSRRIVRVDNSFEYISPVVNYTQVTRYAKETFWQWLKRSLRMTLVPVAYAELNVSNNTLLLPGEVGLYMLDSTVTYDDGLQETIKKEISVLPQGVIFYRPGIILSNEVLVPNANVTLFRKDEALGIFVPAPITSLYGDVNQITTNKTGEYAFNVASGTYKVLVERDAMYPRETEEIVVTDEARVLNDRIEVRCGFFTSFVCGWDVKVLILVLAAFFYRNYRHNTRKARLSTRKSTQR